MKHKILSVLITFTIIFGIIPVSFAADELSAFSEINVSKVSDVFSLSVGKRLGQSMENSWAKFKNVDFGKGGVEGIEIKAGVSTKYEGGVISVHIDSKDSSPIATLTVKATTSGDDWVAQWQEAVLLNDEVSGVHDLYLTYSKAGTADVEAIRMTPKEKILVPESLNGTEYEEKFTVLWKLSILEWDGSSDIDINKKLTVAEFLKMALMLTGDNSDEAISDILRVCGFEQDKKITAEEACEVLLRLLRSNYPGVTDNYYKELYSLGVKCSIDASDKLTYTAAIELLYDACEAEFAVVSAVSPENGGVKVLYSVDENKTILSEYRKIYKHKGIVTMTPTTGLREVSSIYENEAVIDGYLFNSGDIDMEAYLGKEIEYYFESGDYEDTILFVRETVRNETITIDAQDIERYSNGRLSYFDGEKSKSVSIPQNAAMLYNGYAKIKYTSDIYNFDNGTVELISSDGGSTYNVVKIFDTTDYQFTAYSNDILYFRADTKQTINLNSPTVEVILRNRVGKAVELAAVSEGDVLSIAKAELCDGSKTVYTITVGKTVITGNVDSIKADEGKIVIDGKEYSASQTFLKSSLYSAIGVGQSISVYLNMYNQIAFVESNPSKDVVGFLVKVWQSEEDNESVYIRVFSEDNTMADYKCYEKIKVDGVRPQNLLEVLKSGTAARNELMVYSVNALGEVSKINFVQEENSTKTDNGLYHHSNLSNGFYRSSSRAVNGTVVLEDDFFWFKIPEDLTLYDDYIVEKPKFSADDYITCAVYNREQGKMSVEFGLVRYTNGGINDVNDLYYITKMTEECDPETDEIRLKVEYYNGMGKTISTGYVPEKYIERFSSVKRYDAVRFARNAKNEIINVKRVFSLADDTILSASTSYNARSRVNSGYIQRKDGTLIMLQGDNSVYNCVSPAVYVYDSANNTFETGDLSGVTSIENANVGSKIYIYSYHEQIRSVVIVK